MPLQTPEKEPPKIPEVVDLMSGGKTMKAERGGEDLLGRVLFGAGSLETVNVGGGGSDSDEAMLDEGSEASKPNQKIPNVPGKKEGGTKTDRPMDTFTKFGEKNVLTGGEDPSL